MKSLLSGLILGVFMFTLSGCVVTQYQNDKGETCTRRYFTLLGIPFRSCDASTAGAPIAAPVTTEGKEIEIAPEKPKSADYKTTPADTVRQSIRATAQPVI